MKSFFTVIATGMICLCLYLCVDKICKAWLASEMIRNGAMFKPIPIPKK